MQLTHLWLTDFRNYTDTDLALAPDGLTVITGNNGEGKTNLLEAVGWLATLSSFRGAPLEALVRVGGTGTAVVRAEGSRDNRRLLIEGELTRGGRSRVQINRQPLRRSRDLLGAVRVSVFAPDDLGLIKAGPGERRRYLDDLLVAVHPKWDELRSDVERVLRQRGTLLKQSAGRLNAEASLTLDVWDAKLAAAGTDLANARAALVDRLAPAVSGAYGALGGGNGVSLGYVASWRPPVGPGLAEALTEARRTDVRRGVSTVGPHRDDLAITLGGLPSRTHASQGEQRSMALALRLGGHSVVTSEVGSPPVLLLDDVFSELDSSRSSALLASLPAGQALLTTAGPLPPGVDPAAVLAIKDGAIVGAP